MIKKLILLLIPISCFGQLTVTTNSIATGLAQQIMGNGVSVTNATLNCGAQGAGSFTYSGATLGISQGILLTTGFASEAANSSSFLASEKISSGSINDPQLSPLAGSTIYDGCILQFDFIAASPTLALTFCFGSEEYPVYECSTYNDVFGIFLSGTDPSGGNYSASNMAVLPNGLPVSINNVNDGNSQGSCTSSHNQTYYNPNYSGNQIAYNGLTVPITTTRQVSKNTSYHLKIAIADAGDELYDSGIFLKSGVFTCTNTPVVTYTNTGFADTLCNDATTYTLSGGSPAGGYYSGAGVSGNSFSPSVAGIGTHSINYIHTDSTGCGGNALRTVYVKSCATTGLLNHSYLGNITIYPNPVKDILLLTVTEKTTIEIYNSLGEKVMGFVTDKNAIDVSSLAKGPYELRLTNSLGTVYSTKLLKE